MMDIEDYLGAREENFIEELKAFCRFPSVSTDPAYREGIKGAVEFLTHRLQRAGFPAVEVIQTGGTSGRHRRVVRNHRGSYNPGLWAL
jgi:acetylornithine deacetylase/succinyl-diaminopimelate desuccinylase-like protein